MAGESLNEHPPRSSRIGCSEAQRGALSGQGASFDVANRHSGAFSSRILLPLTGGPRDPRPRGGGAIPLTLPQCGGSRLARSWQT